MEKDIKNMQESVDIIAKNTAYILENMVTKDDLKKDLFDLKLDLKTDIHDLRMEVKSFKMDTENSVKELESDITDLEDTDMHHDKRIEKLENKVFV